MRLDLLCKSCHVWSLTLQFCCLTTGWRPAPTKTTSCAGKWKIWSVQTSKKPSDINTHMFTVVNMCGQLD